ncbi:hypothetical protein LTS07_007561 [Exophiala sideris]|nr:hypothetical protein LTS07_007561 [Exophiala sideris]KAK5176458.1 hypothetical protein LTR44_011019 [Eurotiomycetes sp. CCFEE 6388]
MDEEIAVFRATKRRKVARPHREASPDSAPPLTSKLSEIEPSRSVEPGSEERNGGNDGEDPEITRLIRARKNYRRPVAGVRFSNTKSAPEDKDREAESAMIKADQPPEQTLDITSRFVSSTGQVVNVDRHMVDFIDSELARRRTQIASPETSQPLLQQPTAVLPAPATVQSTGSKTATQADPSTSRQLAEIDLGSSAQERNLARTQLALERARLGLPPIDEAPKPQKPRKPRLGPDGKPMKPRPRKGKNNEDMARDALVEQLMRENKLGLYDADQLVQQRQAAVEDAEEESDGSDADERLAEQFGQDFLDAMAERQKSKPASQAKGPGGVAPDAKGPKLGGSRSARAKMAQTQQQQVSGPGKK